MKKIFFIALLALGLCACRQEKFTWENPTAFIPHESNTSFTVTKVEMNGWETVVHLEVNSHPNYWIKVTPGTVLRTDDGQEYTIKHGDATDSIETDLKLDELFWLPKSGKDKIALHFRPVPASTRRMHLIVDNGEAQGYHLWNIRDAANPFEEEWPADWKDLQYDNDEKLPAVKIDKGVATINVKMLDYQPDMKLHMSVHGFRPFGTDEYYFKSFSFADDGTLKIEIPLRIAREVNIYIPGMFDKYIVIAPHQETSILMRVANDPSAILAFKGYMAKTNMDLLREGTDPYDDFIAKSDIMDRLEPCETPEERINCLKETFDKRIEEIQAKDYTPAAKELLCMEAESKYMGWTFGFGSRYANCLRAQGRVKFDRQLWNKVLALSERLLPSNTPNPHTIQYLDRPTASCSVLFWGMSPNGAMGKALNKKKCPLLWDMLAVDEITSPNRTNPRVQPIQDKECQAIVEQYYAEKKRVVEELKQQPNVYYHTYDDVAPKDIFTAILTKYKGKPIFITVWSPENSASCEGNKAMAPIKERLKDTDIQFVYVTTPHTRASKWQEMILDLPGDHYYLTSGQYDYMMKRYESEGCPTYVLYDKTGNRAFQSIGFHGIEPIRQAIEEALK